MGEQGVGRPGGSRARWGRRASLWLLLSAGLLGCGRQATVAPTVESTARGVWLEAESGTLRTAPAAQAVADPLRGGRVINDPAASGGLAVALLGTSDTVAFVVPASLEAGRYTVTVRGRGEAYQGWPTVALHDEAWRRLGTAVLDTATYGPRPFGDLDLVPGQTLLLTFLDDRYDGPGQDRNAVVDFLTAEPVEVDSPPANRPPTVTLRPLDDGNLLRAPGTLPTFESNHHVTLEADVSDPDGRVSRVEFFINGTKIGEDTEAPYRFVDSQERDSSIQGEEVDAYSARAVDDRGAATTSAPVQAALRSRDYTGGSLLPLRAVNLGGPATAQDNFVCSSCPNVVFYEAGGEGNLTTNGTPLTLAPGVAPVPRVLGPEREALVRSALSRPGGLEVSVPVPSALYDVYLWVRAEDATSYDIEMEGRRVARFDPGEAGRWDRLGPFRLTVEDGALDVASLGPATASFSGLELWRVARPGETPPTVAFEPRPEPQATAGQALPLSVTVSAPTERVARVEFYAKDSYASSRAFKIGEATEAPFRIEWQNPPVGQYTVTAVAQGSSGLSVWPSSFASTTVVFAPAP